MTLIEQLESAESGSRELDAAIENAWWLVTWGKKAPKEHIKNAPRYTTSLDAALTLVPEEMRDEIEIKTLYQVARVAINLNHLPDDGPYYGSHEGNSIPLALCIAALRARGV